MKLIAGPCSIENYDILKESAEVLSKIVKDKEIDFFFKSSAVKDNRTDIETYTGVGMKEGISMLLDVKKEFNVKITTDFHNENDIFRYGSYVDLIQIPAFLAKQISLLKAAAKIHKPIHVKKPQFVGPVEALQIYKNLKTLGVEEEIFLTDRGTMFGYNQMIFDPRHIPIMKTSGATVIADVTHPTRRYPHSEDYGYFYSLILARSAVVSGADGIFLETHPNCSEALCDPETMIPLDGLEEFVSDVYNIWKFVN